MPGRHVDDNPFVNLLKNYPETEVVNISGKHDYDLTPLVFSKFRKHLTSLNKIIMNDVNVEFLTDAEVILKFYAANINIEADQRTLDSILKILKRELFNNGLSLESFPPTQAEAVKLIDYITKAKQQQFKLNDDADKKRNELLSNIGDTLFVFEKEVVYYTAKITLYANNLEQAQELLEQTLDKNAEKITSICPQLKNKAGYSSKALNGDEVYDEYHGRRGDKNDIMFKIVSSLSKETKDLSGFQNPQALSSYSKALTFSSWKRSDDQGYDNVTRIGASKKITPH